MSQISHYTVQSAPRAEGKGLSLTAQIFGAPPTEGRFLLFPGGHSFRLKNVRSSTEEKDVILELKGISRNRVREGDILIPEGLAAGEGRKALVLWKQKIRDASSLSLQLRDTPDLQSPDSVSISEGDNVVLLSSRLSFIQIPGQIYEVSKGSQKGEFLLLMAEPWSPDELKKMKARLAKNKNFPGEEAVFSMNLRVRGAMPLPPSLQKSEFEGSVKVGGWVLMSRTYDKVLSVLDKRTRSEEGLTEEQLSELLNLPLSLCREISGKRIEEGLIIRKKGFLLNKCEDHRDFLSPMSRMWLEGLVAAGSEGLPIKETFHLGSRLHAMERRGLLRVFEGFVIDEESYKSQTGRLMEILPRDKDFEMTDIKGFENLSRSRLIAFLDTMENDGLIKTSEGHTRRVVEESEA
ncbi:MULTISPECIES: hypothetical protein [unclassified Oceanispirochaeta]|uniref:hypothetical protein n=1 Tax=unclassified Oceanispirochaeta TaxID=2635722 RepID=UPI000E09B529|nr:MULTISPECIES: hypothetical protein [unclassified Oceanispirochaeta]MBF9016840.1 hypothetical protein [Oceanispirochaeta sp. M2]NPD73203.1 hypothetical protein [Oceanispirochaeta sp. M1]RDG31071.1 hypothetical protein DV872_13965 [Oceanispirochaeta sp. M1]